MRKFSKKYLYILIWLFVLCVFIASYIFSGSNYILKALYIVFSAINLLISQFMIAKKGDDIVKSKAPALYERYYKKYGKYTVWPVNIAGILILTGKYREYKYLKDIITETLVYFIFSVAVIVSIFAALLA